MLPRIEVLRGLNDQGVVMGGAAVDEERTFAAVLDSPWAEDLENLMDLRNNFDEIDDIFKRDGTKDCTDIIREMV